MPSLTDDGHDVTLDLHGATVDEAMHLSREVIHEAVLRGRKSVKLIHGSSTSSSRYRNRTIKHALYDALDAGYFSDKVTGLLRTRNVLTLSLDLSATSDPTPLRMSDFSY